MTSEPANPATLLIGILCARSARQHETRPPVLAACATGGGRVLGVMTAFGSGMAMADEERMKQVPPLQEYSPPKATHLSRRALLTLGALGVCGGAVVAAPRVAPAIEQHLKDAALDAGLDELRQLEGVSLDAAIRAAEITQAAVTVIVLPLARFISLLGSGALAVLLVHLPTTTLDQFRAVVASWQVGVASLPISLDAYLTADITSGEAYLKALKRRMAQQRAV
jgi:hypothetical protein